MVLLGDDAQVEADFGPFRESGNPDARYVHSFHRTYHGLRKSFWTHPMKFLGYVGYVESHFGPFGDSVSVSAR
jgi:hypothetical protein